MIITFSGDNDFLIAEELSKLKDKLFKTASDLNVTVINSDEADLDDLKLELSGYSLFASERLFILNEPSKIKGFADQIEELSTVIPEETSVIINEPSLDKRKSYYKYLLKNTDFKQLDKLAKPSLEKWLIKYVSDQLGNISNSDAAYLIDRIGDDQLRLSQEVNKLILYSKDITRHSIDLLTEQSDQSTIFELLDAAFSLSPAKALIVYNGQRLRRVEPEQILAMLSWQLNTLALYMSSKNTSASSGLSPYTESKARQIATKLPYLRLKQLIKELTNLDFRYKTMTLDLDEGLKNFIVDLSI